MIRKIWDFILGEAEDVFLSTLNKEHLGKTLAKVETGEYSFEKACSEIDFLTRIATLRAIIIIPLMVVILSSLVYIFTK